MIRKLSKTEQEISLTELAEEFQISQRTIRNDLNAINDLLTEQGLVNLKLGRGGGNHSTIREQKAGIK